MQRFTVRHALIRPGPKIDAVGPPLKCNIKDHLVRLWRVRGDIDADIGPRKAGSHGHVVCSFRSGNPTYLYESQAMHARLPRALGP